MFWLCWPASNIQYNRNVRGAQSEVEWPNCASYGANFLTKHVLQMAFDSLTQFSILFCKNIPLKQIQHIWLKYHVN